MEGAIYDCEWKKATARYKLWLRDQKDVFVTAPSFREAEEKMWELICLKFGDGEAVLQFEPAPPVDSFLQGFDYPAIVSVAGNDTVDANRHTTGLFTRDYCPTCTRAWGERTNVELEVEGLPNKSDGALCMAIPFLGRMFSEAFLELLNQEERARFRWLKVRSKTPARRAFFELLGESPIKFVGLSGLPGFDPVPCHQCRYQPESHLFKNAMYEFLALEDLPKPIPTVFAAGFRGTTLCMTAARWQALKGKPGTRNLVAEPIRVIPKRRAVKTGG